MSRKDTPGRDTREVGGGRDATEQNRQRGRVDGLQRWDEGSSQQPGWSKWSPAIRSPGPGRQLVIDDAVDGDCQAQGMKMRFDYRHRPCSSRIAYRGYDDSITYLPRDADAQQATPPVPLDLALFGVCDRLHGHVWIVIMIVD
ncbi:hypothetical protein TgHK011_000305 [Trichoderma gracile]|nr:hypothetical protein TgHK011_000305 [Trichoderma gracile]